MTRIFPITFMMLIFLFCKCVKEDKPAELSVDKMEFELTDGHLSDIITIKNDGELNLSWQILTDDNLLTFSETKGNLLKGSFITEFSVSNLIEPGEHSLSFVIKSNGGEILVNVHIKIADREGIIPGNGTYHVPLYSTSEFIKNIYGAPNAVYANYIQEYSVYLNEADYYDFGIGFLYISEFGKVIRNDDAAISIILFDSFPEKTKEGLTVNSTLDDVISKYGEPEIIDQYYGQYHVDVYQYNSRGITFNYANSDFTKTYYIEIYEPHKKSMQEINKYFQYRKYMGMPHLLNTTN